jgi:single-stranded-DNA-specific exonuclease
VIEPRYRWVLQAGPTPSPALLALAAEAGLGPRATTILAARGVATPAELDAFLAPAELGLHDPKRLPDADRLRGRVERARRDAETVMVFGDFDADGLTGLAILVIVLRSLGLSVLPYVPSRLDEGHGLSLAAVDAAATAGATLIVTVDTGSSSVAEAAAAAERGIDVLITDHHRVPLSAPAVVALVNPHRVDASYPDRRLSGAGVAFKVAQLLLAAEPGGPGRALDLADLATIGTVSDMAPIVGENRAIARLGLDRLRAAPRPGLAALLARSGAKGPVDLETVGFVLAPRLNAAGRVGEAMDAASLLLSEDPAQAEALAETLDTANLTRRDLTRQVLAEARLAAGDHGGPATVVRGPWPVGIIGLVASRLSEDTGRPAVVGAELGDLVRASCRGGPGVDLAATLERCGDLLVRHGGHAGAAGFEVAATHWDALRDRFLALVATTAPADPRLPLAVDLALPARAIDYGLVRDLARLAPFGTGNPEPAVAVLGLTVTRVRATNGGHTQLVLRRDPDVLDGIAFGRDDLATTVAEGDRVDVVARLVSRTFGGFESLQLEVRDVASAGELEARPATGGGAAAGGAGGNVASSPATGDSLGARDALVGGTR